MSPPRKAQATFPWQCSKFSRWTGISGLWHVSDGLMFLHCLLPFLAIDILRNNAVHGAFIQTMGSYSVTIGIRARSIKALYTTGLAECVLGTMCVEGVCCQIISTLQQLETRSWDNEVSVLLLCANAAVAVKNMQICWSPDFKADGSAVTASCVFDQTSVFTGERSNREVM